MKKRELGNSGLFVSELGFGCMSLPNDETEAKNIIEAALQAGITYFDTADLYDAGRNEELVGKALGNKRKDVVLATKVGNQVNPDGNGWTWNPTKQHILESVKKSLQRLGTDYIDLYQLHGGTMEDNVDETIDAFEQLKKEGIILQYGISSIRPNVIERFLKKSSGISVMMQHSLLDRRPEEWFPMIQKEGASVITRGTITKGLLTAEGLERAARSEGFGLYTGDEVRHVVNTISTEVEDLHAAAISYVLQEPTVATALIGASSTEQLLDSVIAYEKEVDDVQLEKLAKMVSTHRYLEHRPNEE